MANPIDLSGATSLEQQAYQVGLEMQKQELAVPAEDRPDNTSVTFDTENSTVDISITLDTSLNVVNGEAVISAQPYLA